MTEPFVMEGDLWLLGQERGFADNAWTLKVRDTVSPMEAILSVVSNAASGFLSLDKEVAIHFNVQRERYTGSYHIGQVRITIERIEAEGE